MSTLKVAALQGVSASSDAITLANDGTCTANITNNLSNRNLIINGAMQVAQRGTSFTSVTASAYHLDRFQYNLNGTVGAATVTQATVTDLAGFTKSLKVDCTTADASLATGDRLTLRYALEGQDLQQVAKGTSSAKQLTLSFYIKATKTGTQIVELFDHDNTRHCAKSVTINSSNTWERKTISYPADTTGALDNDNANSISIFFGIACGTDYTSGTLATAWASNTNANRFVGQVNHFDNTANNFEITGVQLEVDHTGSGVATDFEHRSLAVEKRLCMRYYQQYTNIMSVGYVPNNGSKSYSHGFNFPVEMRAAPTLTISNTGSTAGQYVNDGDTNRNVSSLNAHASQTYQIEYYFNLSGDLADFRGAYAVSSTSTTHQTTYYITAEL